MTTDDLLNEIGGFGRFQVYFILAIYSHKLNVGWSMLQMSYAGFIPDWQCEPRPGSDNGTLFSNQTLNKCSINVSQTGFQKQSCYRYRFEGSSHTIINEWDIVCDRKWIKATVTSIQMFGVLLGAISIGQLSDMFGRKKALFAYSLVHALLNIGAAFSPNWEVFGAFRFFIGIGIGGILVATFPYPMEFMPIKSRHVLVAFPAWMCSVGIFSVAALILDNWAYLHIACGVCGLLPLLLYFWVAESARWLIIQGRIKEAAEVFKKVATTNKKELPSNTTDVLEKIYQEEQRLRSSGRKYSYWDLFRSWKMVKVSLILSYVWFILSLVFYGISFGVSALAGNLYLNIFLLALVELPGYWSTVYLNNKFGRKITGCGLFLLTLIASAGCLLVQFTMDSDSRGIYVTVLSLVAKLGIGTAWAVIQVHCSELYPTVVRNLAYGLFNSASRVGGILAPFVLDLDERQVESYIIISAAILVTIVLMLFVPETKGQALKDSLDPEEAQAKSSSEPNGKLPETVINGNKCQENGLSTEDKDEGINKLPDVLSSNGGTPKEPVSVFTTKGCINDTFQTDEDRTVNYKF